MSDGKSNTAVTSSAFNVQNYRRLEKYNNILNAISVVLMFLALASIIVVFFSLQASREGELIVVLAQERANLDAVAFIMFYQPAYYYPKTGNTEWIPNSSNEEFGLKLVITKFEKSSEDREDQDGALEEEALPTKTTNRTLSYSKVKADREGILRLYLGKPSQYVRYGLDCGENDDESKIVLPKDGKIQNPNNISFCEPSLPEVNEDYSIQIEIEQNKEDEKKERILFLRAYIRTYLYFHQPKAFIQTECACEAPICSQQLSIAITERHEKVVGTSYTSSATESSVLVHFGQSPKITLLAERGNFNTSLPSNLAVLNVEEQDKYSTGDTVIDSLAISGIIVSGILLAVTLAKLLLWIVYHPGRRS